MDKKIIQGVEISDVRVELNDAPVTCWVWFKVNGFQSLACLKKASDGEFLVERHDTLGCYNEHEEDVTVTVLNELDEEVYDEFLGELYDYLNEIVFVQTHTTDEELVKSWIKNLETSELIELWETLTSEINNPSVIWDMDFFLEDYLPECISSKHMDVLELARIVTGNDCYVEHFDINDDFVYINHLGLWESINDYDIVDLVMGFIDDYDAIEYSDTIKNKLSEIKEENED